MCESQFLSFLARSGVRASLYLQVIDSVSLDLSIARRTLVDYTGADETSMSDQASEPPAEQAEEELVGVLEENFLNAVWSQERRRRE
jgi:hypothetical protein